ncbi:hypothetical protein ACEQ8H_002653 [Pleosporales sp. CAS-2024a]
MGLNPDGSRIETPSLTAPALDIDAKANFAAIASSINDAAALATQAAPETIAPEYIELPIDNFYASKKQSISWYGTFYNRYWVSSRAYQPGSPVFLYDVGEADASTNALFRLQDATSFFRQLVDKYQGIGIVWEHRFYGNSSPTPVDINTPAEDFTFLTTEQSLADVHVFAQQFDLRDRGINSSLTPDKTPWVFVGGSYPGMRAAFMRNTYPNTIFAAYASSAPVQAVVDQSFYFDPMWRGMQKYGFGNCSRDIQAAVRYIDKVLDGKNGSASDALKVQFLGLGAEKNSHGSFADALTTILSAWMSYGVEGGVLGLRRFCDWIETDEDGMMPVVSSSQGWSGKKGAKWVAQRWASYPWFVANVNKYLETECSGRDNVQGDCNLNKKFTEPAMISWVWQYCTQWGYFQSANLGPQQLVSKYNSLSHWKDVCHRQFPDAPHSLFPEWPDVNRTNRIFGGWNIRPSNTYWSNGEFDPWRTLSPTSTEPAAPNTHVFKDAPQCGHGQRRGELFGYIIPDAQHCYDFRTTGTIVPGGAGFSLGKNVDKSMFDIFAHQPGRGARFGMLFSTADEPPKTLLDNYPWDEVQTFVDVGGSHGSIAVELTS